MSIYSSIYIPRMSVDHTEESIVYYMMKYHIGNVSHIDFTPINKKPGFGENVDQVVKSAFVHFSETRFCSDKVYRFQDGTDLRNSEFWQTIANGQPYKLQISQKEYWLCLKNKNPIQRTMMNIHQVVENGRHLENLLMQQAEDIKNLKETTENQEKIIQGLRNVVYQLIGGLYCQSTQAGMIDIHLSQLNIKSSKESISNDTHPFGNWPTTRQGDENSKRLDTIEHYIEHHILPEAKKSYYCEIEDDENTSQIDTELLERKHCAGCGIELAKDYEEEEYERIQEEQEYERIQEEQEKRMFRNHRI